MLKSLIREKKYILCLGLCIILYTGFFTFLEILKYKAFFSFDWEDLAIYNNILWNTSQGNLFYCGIFNTIFFQHMQIILGLVALFYRIIPHIYTLFFIRTLFLAIGSIPVYLIFRANSTSKTVGTLAAITYLLNPCIHYLNFIDFRPVILSVPFLIFAFYFFTVKKFSQFVIFSMLAVLCKENIPFVISMFGLKAFIERRSKRWIIFPILTIIWSFLSLNLILPYFGYPKGSQTDIIMGGSFGVMGILRFVISNPTEAMRIIFSREHFDFFLKLFNPPLYFLSILQPAVLIIALPSFAQVFFQEYPLPINCSHQITPIVIFIFLAAMLSTIMISRWLSSLISNSYWPKNRVQKYLMITFIISSLLASFGTNIIGVSYNEDVKHNIYDTRFLNSRNIFESKFYIQDESDLFAWDLIRLIPPNASVSASGDLLAPLSNRSRLYEFGSLNDHYLKTDYIILHTKNPYHGDGGLEVDNAASVERIPEIVASGFYELIAKKGDFLLFERFLKEG